MLVVVVMELLDDDTNVGCRRGYRSVLTVEYD